ncbi:anti-sigma-E factor RseA [Martelella alba]|uniref:Anti-sigma-E factor RseA n=1 Tax=Martelella alba TaxID=2590451 RepID=A0ABY2SRS6_9HYPH|nr:anti-sigma-E factor RseA [Martelella alba]TKI06781.1 anti-sigma-E factor RseA [Martelella alba]
MRNEKLSALMDGEILDNELINSLSKDDKLQQSWRNYHLIRDTLRGDIGETLHLDIADRVAAAIADEPVRLVPDAVKESQPRPETWHKLPFWRRASPWVSHAGQMGLAACVSLAVIFGVQYYNRPMGNPADSQPESPVFNTLPMMGQASPVSLGVPSGGMVADATTQQQLVQEQRKRINAILQDYELQRRVHSTQMQFDQHETQQAAVQVPGTQSLGMQPQ